MWYSSPISRILEGGTKKFGKGNFRINNSNRYFTNIVNLWTSGIFVRGT